MTIAARLILAEQFKSRFEPKIRAIPLLMIGHLQHPPPRLRAVWRIAPYPTQPRLAKPVIFLCPVIRSCRPRPNGRCARIKIKWPKGVDDVSWRQPLTLIAVAFVRKMDASYHLIYMAVGV
jgi:hypothetical protein